MHRIAFILGTRPEIIKLAPVVRQMQAAVDLQPLIFFTSQHQELAEQAFADFALKPDFTLSAPRETASLAHFLKHTTEQLQLLLTQEKPTTVIVQGDTTSALAGALAAFRLQIPLAHIEAGLRTYDYTSPFPEEINRQLISQLATIHLCPTKQSQDNLQQENAGGEIHLVGNTVIDAVRQFSHFIPTSAKKANNILVSGHRRENLDGGLRLLCTVLKRLAHDFPSINIQYLSHPNPTAKQPILELLSRLPQVEIVQPLSYLEGLQLLASADFLITDSGGFQEEAACFQKRVLVTRKITERPELIECGLGELVPLDNPENVYNRIAHEIQHPRRLISKFKNPFGDGEAASRIIRILSKVAASRSE